jgi:hypothetical protein
MGELYHQYRLTDEEIVFCEPHFQHVLEALPKEVLRQTSSETPLPASPRLTSARLIRPKYQANIPTRRQPHRKAKRINQINKNGTTVIDGDGITEDVKSLVQAEYSRLVKEFRCIRRQGKNNGYKFKGRRPSCTSIHGCFAGFKPWVCQTCQHHADSRERFSNGGIYKDGMRVASYAIMRVDPPRHQHPDDTCEWKPLTWEGLAVPVNRILESGLLRLVVDICDRDLKVMILSPLGLGLF